MNVLVYSGPEIIQTSLNHSLTTLRAILLPHYTIQSVTPHILTTQPWQKSCALLVLPQTRGGFASVPSKHIKNFVEGGGSCLLLGFRPTIPSRSTGGNFGLGPGLGFDDVIAGKLTLWIPNIERPLEIKEFETLRLKFLRKSLMQLGLQLPSEDEGSKAFSRPLPQFLTSTPKKSTLVSRVMDGIAAPQPGSRLSVFKDTNDEFHFHALQESFELLESARAKSASEERSDPATWQPKHVLVCLDGSLPPQELTPLFDLRTYYEALATAQEKEGSVGTAKPWRMGEVLLYGEAVTSTQTMLDKNPRLLIGLPTPLVSLASYQLAGRGRGSNVWLSPSGCLLFSLLLRVSLSTFPPSKLVFVQYLISLAVAEACRSESVLGAKAGRRVRLKWPNDLYAVIGPDEEANTKNVRKIGGVLVSVSFMGGIVNIVIGCGLNVLNLAPMTSLSQLRGAASTNLNIERTAASIISKFESMWAIFTHEEVSFKPFMDLYLERWMHSDQLVTITTTTPHRQVRLLGITEDHGLLRTIPERSGLGRFGSTTVEYVDLRPDGNSFDLMANLIKAKN